MFGKVYVVDGVSNSGKTTFCKKISDDNNIMIEEAPSFVRNHKELFNYDDNMPMPKNVDDEILLQNFLLNVEIERVKMAYYVIKSGKNAILDRSFLSTMSVAYSFDFSDKNMNGVYLNSLRLYRQYYKFIKNLCLDDSFEYFFLITSPEEITKRNQTREKQLSKNWIDEKLMSLQNNFFINFKEQDANIIDTSNLTQEEVFVMLNKKINGGIKK